MNKVIVFSRFKSLLLLLFVISSCGVNFVDSFGALPKDMLVKKTLEEGSVLYNCYITISRKHDANKNIFDHSINFISKGLYLFRLLALQVKDPLETTFFKKKSTIKNLFVNILTFPCYNFFSMKRYNKLSWLPFNSNNKLYLGITNLGFEGVAGGIVGGLLGRIAFVFDISSVLNYSFVKDKVTFTLAGVRPLYLALFFIQKQCEILHLYDGQKKNILLHFDIKEEDENGDDKHATIFMPILSCFQILALECKWKKYLSIQLCFGDLIVDLLKHMSKKGEEKSSNANVSITTTITVNK